MQPGAPTLAFTAAAPTLRTGPATVRPGTATLAASLPAPVVRFRTDDYEACTVRPVGGFEAGPARPLSDFEACAGAVGTTFSRCGEPRPTASFTLAKVESGLVFRDEFNREDEPLTSPWIVFAERTAGGEPRVKWDVVDGVLEVTDPDLVESSLVAWASVNTGAALTECVVQLEGLGELFAAFSHCGAMARITENEDPYEAYGIMMPHESQPGNTNRRARPTVLDWDLDTFGRTGPLTNYFDVTDAPDDSYQPLASDGYVRSKLHVHEGGGRTWCLVNDNDPRRVDFTLPDGSDVLESKLAPGRPGLCLDTTFLF